MAEVEQAVSEVVQLDLMHVDVDREDQANAHDRSHDDRAPLHPLLLDDDEVEIGVVVLGRIS